MQSTCCDITNQNPFLDGSVKTQGFDPWNDFFSEDIKNSTMGVIYQKMDRQFLTQDRDKITNNPSASP